MMSIDRLWNTSAAVAIVACAGVVMPGCEEDRVTAENYDAINVGMTLGQVEGIMGGAGEKQEVTGTSISGAGLAGAARSTQEIYVWRSGRNEISVTVVADKIVNKSKAGF